MKRYIVKLWQSISTDGNFYWRLYMYDPIGGEYIPVGSQYSSPMDALDRILVHLLEEMDDVGRRPIKDGEALLFRRPCTPEGPYYDAMIEVISNPGIPEDKVGGRTWTEQKIY